MGTDSEFENLNPAVLLGLRMRPRIKSVALRVCRLAANITLAEEAYYSSTEADTVVETERDLIMGRTHMGHAGIRSASSYS